VNGKLYWSDREGMRVMRCNLDGSGLETLIETGHGDDDRRDARNWPVGIALDVEGGKLYWTQKGNNADQGRIFRANLEIPEGQTPATRKDIEGLYDGLPEPICDPARPKSPDEHRIVIPRSAPSIVAIASARHVGSAPPS
jgi:hypothetical protein